MKNILIITLLIGLVMSVSAQKKPKIKGDKELVTIEKTIDKLFNKVEIDGPFEVEIFPSATSKYTLVTDGNLADVIIVKVQDSTLKIYSTHRITRSKKLQIELYVTEVEQLVLRNDAELESQGLLEGSILKLEAYNSSKFDLDIETRNEVSIALYENAGGKLTIQSNDVEVSMKDRTDLKADISATITQIDLNDNAELKIEGDSDKAVYTLSDGVHLKAQKMKVTDVVLNATNNVDVFLHASKNVALYAKGKSTIYLYGEPKIDIKGLGDSAKLIKKD